MGNKTIVMVFLLMWLVGFEGQGREPESPSDRGLNSSSSYDIPHRGPDLHQREASRDAREGDCHPYRRKKEREQDQPLQPSRRENILSSFASRSSIAPVDPRSYWPSERWSSEVEKRFQAHMSLPQERSRREKIVQGFLENLQFYGIHYQHLPGAIISGRLDLGEVLFALNEKDKLEILKFIEKLDWLDELLLDSNGLTHLPRGLASLANLKILDLSRNQLQEIPLWFWDLPALENLDLSENKIVYLYHRETGKGIGNLRSLISLHLHDNKISSLPYSFVKLGALQELYLNSNPLIHLPEDIGKLGALKNLECNYCSLTDLPSSFKDLVSLETLGLKGTPMEVVPDVIGQMPALKYLDLSACLSLRNSGRPGYYGRNDLQHLLGGKVKLGPIPNTILAQEIAREYIFMLLDQQSLRINRERLREMKLPEIPLESPLPGAVVLAYLDKIINSLNLEDTDRSDYISYEALAYELEDELLHSLTEEEKKSLTNHQKVHLVVLPKVRGYVKSLFQLPLDVGERPGWQMNGTSQVSMKLLLSYLLEWLSQCMEPTHCAAVFTQFANGLLHCPAGQKESLETIMINLLGQEGGFDKLKYRFERLLAFKKNMAFRHVILTRCRDVSQNTHLLAFYGEKLGYELGLETGFKKYREIFTLSGIDPFEGSEVNVLKAYYDHVTPQHLVKWVLEETYETTEEENSKSSIPDKRAASFQKLLTTYQQTLESKKRKVEEETLGPDEIATLQHQIKFLDMQISNLVKHLSVNSEQPPSNLIDSGKKRAIDKKSGDKITTQDVLEYLLEEGLIRPQNPEWLKDNPQWWAPYFSHSPEENERAKLTERGAEALLLHMGILISSER